MGSFNTTCFASNQTIAPGDACWVIPIRQCSGGKPVEMQHRDKKYSEYAHASTTCYPTAFWEPVGEPISAIYYDYGRVDVGRRKANVTNVLGILQYLLEFGAVVDVGENQYHDLAFDIKKFITESASSVVKTLDCEVPDTSSQILWDEVKLTWDYVWEVAHEHRLFIGATRSKPVRQFQFAILHDSAYQRLIELYEGQEPRDGVPNERRAFVDYALSLSVEAPKTGGRMAVYEVESTLRNAGYVSSYCHQLRNDPMRLLVHEYTRGSMAADQFYTKVKPWVDFRYFLAGLEMLNLKFSPLVCASQDYSNDVGEMYAKFVSTVSTEVCRERLRDGEGTSE